MPRRPPSEDRALRSVIDRSLKLLVRDAAPAFFRLAGLDIAGRPVGAGDVAINLPEYRADQVFVIGGEGDADRCAVHLEYQLQPDPRVVLGWFLKNAALTAHLRMPVLLVVVYLNRGGRATFPAEYRVASLGVENAFRFHAVCLWEHQERIRSGELPELAPLLVLCEDKPTEATLREERELILSAGLSSDARKDLLGVAILVGRRYFDGETLRRVFREEMEMLKGVDFIDEWIAESFAKGEAQGEARGELRKARAIALDALRKRFGELPPSVVQHVESADAQACSDLVLRLLDGVSLQELGLAS
jgi:hypothetical protein